MSRGSLLVIDTKISKWTSMVENELDLGVVEGGDNEIVISDAKLVVIDHTTSIIRKWTTIVTEETHQLSFQLTTAIDG